MLSRLLRLFFHLLYHPFACTYDFVAAFVSVGMWQDWIKTVLPSLDGEMILEIGHGPGHLQRHLHEQGRAPLGLDRSPQMGRMAAHRLRGASLPGKLFRAIAENIPLPENSLDQVVATFPAEYIAAPETLSEVWRVLKPGGQFIILPIAVITGKQLRYRFAAWLFRITGQTRAAEDGLQRFCEYYEEAGFQTSVQKHIVRDASEVYIVTATKKTI